MRLRNIISSVVLLALVAGGAAGYWLYGLPQRTMRHLGERIQADYDDQVTLFFHTNSIRPHSKLVVAELRETVSGTIASQKTWLGIDLGETSLDYRLPVKLFYAVDLTGPQPVVFQIDHQRQQIVAEFPNPELLAAEPDLRNADKTVDIGWGRLRAFSGEHVEARYERELLNLVKQQADTFAMRSLVRETARRQLANYVKTYLVEQDAWGARGFTRIAVRFHREPQSVTQTPTLEAPTTGTTDWRQWWPLH